MSYGKYQGSLGAVEPMTPAVKSARLLREKILAMLEEKTSWGRKELRTRIDEIFLRVMEQMVAGGHSDDDTD